MYCGIFGMDDFLFPFLDLDVLVIITPLPRWKQLINNEQTEYGSVTYLFIFLWNMADQEDPEVPHQDPLTSLTCHATLRYHSSYPSRNALKTEASMEHPLHVIFQH